LDKLLGFLVWKFWVLVHHCDEEGEGTFCAMRCARKRKILVFDLKNLKIKFAYPKNLNKWR
jgi:hypothetical protein